MTFGMSLVTCTECGVQSTCLENPSSTVMKSQPLWKLGRPPSTVTLLLHIRCKCPCLLSTSADHGSVLSVRLATVTMGRQL